MMTLGRRSPDTQGSHHKVPRQVTDQIYMTHRSAGSPAPGHQTRFYRQATRA